MTISSSLGIPVSATRNNRLLDFRTYAFGAHEWFRYAPASLPGSRYVSGPKRKQLSANDPRLRVTTRAETTLPTILMMRLVAANGLAATRPSPFLVGRTLTPAARIQPTIGSRFAVPCALCSGVHDAARRLREELYEDTDRKSPITSDLLL